jgi:hypothetical protein
LSTECFLDSEYANHPLCTAFALFHTQDTAEYGSAFGLITTTDTDVALVSVNADRKYMDVTTSGIPSYNHELSTAEIEALNSRPLAVTDFVNGSTSAMPSEHVHFGEDIGYRGLGETFEVRVDAAGGCAAAGCGYWPTGPVCPIRLDKTVPLNSPPSLTLPHSSTPPPPTTSPPTIHPPHHTLLSSPTPPL